MKELKPLTEEERAYFMRDVEIIKDNFITAVVKNRGLDIEKVRELADGSSMLGQMALKNGLIDKIGGQFEAEKHIEEQIEEEVEVCWR